MKIMFDHQAFMTNNYGGVARYFCELVYGLNNDKNVVSKINLLISNNPEILSTKTIYHLNILPNINFKGYYRAINYINKLYTISKLKNKDYDIFHPTYYDPYFLEYLDNVPYVLTVYDMIHEKYKNLFSNNDKTSYNKKLLIEKSKKIIAISHNTKNDIIDLFGVDPSKIDVVYLGNSINLETKVDLNFKLPNRYLLYVGSRALYKNFQKFIKSISEILKKDLELFVLCIGGGVFSKSEKDLFINLGISKNIMQYNLNNESMSFFYKNALAFVYPSLYEGFGIPILEAFACECPVICSNTSSLPEIANNAAYYFDPYDQLSIKNEILKILDNKEKKNDLISKGKERLKFFSWKKTSEQTLKLYRNILL